MIEEQVYKGNKTSYYYKRCAEQIWKSECHTRSKGNILLCIRNQQGKKWNRTQNHETDKGTL